MSQISHKNLKTWYYRTCFCVRYDRFEKVVLSNLYFAIQMLPKSNCIWMAERRMGGDVSCSSFSMKAINEDSLF